MAEIKSTMDLVMERAARIGKASSEELRLQEAMKKGVQLAVEFLDDKIDSLLEAVGKEEGSIQVSVLRGIGETLLRNIFLPRDEIQQERAQKAVSGITSLEGSSGEVASMCAEITNILAGYLQHRDQLKGQLEEQIKQYYDNLMAQQQGMQRGGMQFDQAQQPKFQEEWSRVETELNNQYGNALDQLKQHISTRLGIV